LYPIINLSGILKPMSFIQIRENASQIHDGLIFDPKPVVNERERASQSRETCNEKEKVMMGGNQRIDSKAEMQNSLLFNSTRETKNNIIM